MSISICLNRGLTFNASNMLHLKLCFKSTDIPGFVKNIYIFCYSCFNDFRVEKGKERTALSSHKWNSFVTLKVIDALSYLIRKCNQILLGAAQKLCKLTESVGESSVGVRLFALAKQR